MARDLAHRKIAEDFRAIANYLYYWGKVAAPQNSHPTFKIIFAELLLFRIRNVICAAKAGQKDKTYRLKQSLSSELLDVTVDIGKIYEDARLVVLRSMCLSSDELHALLIEEFANLEKSIKFNKNKLLEIKKFYTNDKFVDKGSSKMRRKVHSARVRLAGQGIAMLGYQESLQTNVMIIPHKYLRDLVFFEQAIPKTITLLLGMTRYDLCPVWISRESIGPTFPGAHIAASSECKPLSDFDCFLSGSIDDAWDALKETAGWSK